MTSNSAEKRPRLDEQRNIRTINLDLDDFPKWVGEASAEELIKIFKIGVMVKESVESNVTFKQKEIDDLLTEKFEPMSTTIKTLADDLTQRVQKVIEKVPPLTDINNKIDTALNTMTTMYNKPAKKGIAGENVVMELLQELTSHTIQDVASKKDMKGDLHVTSPFGYKYLIEVKNRQNAVPAREIEKFESEVKRSSEFKVGIMLSLDSGIAQRARGRRFEVAYVNKQYFIYVPNMMRDTDLAVWSVSLADELAAMSPENLNETKLNDMRELYNEFKDCMDKSKKCKGDLEALKNVTTSLEENLVPILKVIDKAKAKLNAILH